jgi:putative lipoprotein
VSLQDVSLADAPAVVLDEQKGPVKGQVPLPFHLSYDPAQVKPATATRSARASKSTAS